MEKAPECAATVRHAVEGRAVREACRLGAHRFLTGLQLLR
jgi:hypothetical protein